MQLITCTELQRRTRPLTSQESTVLLLMTFSFWLSTFFANPQGQLWKCSVSCCKTVAKRITDTLMSCNSFSAKKLNAAFQDRQAWKQVLETTRFNSSVFIVFIYFRPSKRPLLLFFCSLEHTNMDGVRVSSCNTGCVIISLSLSSFYVSVYWSVVLICITKAFIGGTYPGDCRPTATTQQPRNLWNHGTRSIEKNERV